MSALDHLADIGPESIRPLKRAEYEHMVAAGLFEDERVELLEGVLVSMSPQSPAHAATIRRIERALRQALGERVSISVQMPFAAGADSLPEPDIAVIPPGDYEDAHPHRAFLIVEVADSSSRRDRQVKAEIYARAGVPEYWVVSIADQWIHIHTEPKGNAYGRIKAEGLRDEIPLVAFPDVRIPVADILR